MHARSLALDERSESNTLRLPRLIPPVPSVQDAYMLYLKVVQYISQVLQWDSRENGELVCVCVCARVGWRWEQVLL